MSSQELAAAKQEVEQCRENYQELAKRREDQSRKFNENQPEGEMESLGYKLVCTALAEPVMQELVAALVKLSEAQDAYLGLLERALKAR
ncbi:MAG TPA: hypothetical protein VFA15_09955 [Nitrososphaera sp.]|nr:hypothetical protein [Nitrososphaera sp.]